MYYSKSTSVKRAFSLIEATVVVAIILSAVLVIGVFVSAVAVRKAVQLQSTASRIATETLEEIVAKPFDSIPSGGSISHPRLADLPSGTGTYASAVFQGNPDIKEVSTTIIWALKGAQKKLTQSTLVIKD